MSGPKVVRIVTREEILETCFGQLARLDAAIAEWLDVGARNDLADEQAGEALRERREALARLIDADRFVQFQKQAMIEEAFVRDDLRRRFEEAAARQAAARSNQRREQEAAAALLNALRSAGTALPAELEEGLERGESEAVARGLLMLGPGTASKTDSALAARLKESEGGQSYADWVRQCSEAGADPAISRIEQRIAEISQLGSTEREAEWRARIAEAEALDGARRNLILDHLEVQTGRALTSLRKRSAARSELKLMMAEADAASVDAAAIAEELEQLGTQELLASAASLRDRIEAARTERAVAARRAVVLEGLSALGYEVNEGMQTLWASEGRLVLKSAARPDYGVELAGSERVQMRPVAFEHEGNGPEASRDRDAETIWCGDVSALRQRLATLGDSLEIERAQPIGTVPLKRIERTDSTERREQRAPRRTRTLD